MSTIFGMSVDKVLQIKELATAHGGFDALEELIKDKIKAKRIKEIDDMLDVLLFNLPIDPDLRTIIRRRALDYTIKERV